MTPAAAAAAPAVSFLLAVYDDARFVPATLRSILAQTFGDFELVVVDDASTDGTADIVRSTGDPRVRYVRNERNLGQVPSLNRGLGLCRAPLVARIDGDDLCEPDRLAHQVGYMRDHPGVSACATWTTEVDEHDRVVGGVEPPDDVDHVRWSLCHTLRLYHPSMMFRRADVAAVGGYDPSYPATEDYELWTRLVAAGRPIGVVPRRLIRYRRRAGQLSDVHGERQRAVGSAIATRYVSRVLGKPCAPRAVAAMRSLLSWRPVDPATLSADSVREALALMWELRRALLGRAAAAARTAADAEVGAHLLRQGRRLLRDAPARSIDLAAYLMRLPRHRRSGLVLLFAGARCAAGRRQP